MSLLDEYSESYVIMDRVTTSDGYGGYTSSYTEGATINGSLAPATESEVTVADAMGEKTTHTLIISKDITLDYHTVLKRSSDSQIFRVTSSGKEYYTPPSSSLNIRKVTLELWELPAEE